MRWLIAPRLSAGRICWTAESFHEHSPCNHKPLAISTTVRKRVKMRDVPLVLLSLSRLFFFPRALYQPPGLDWQGVLPATKSLSHETSGLGEKEKALQKPPGLRYESAEQKMGFPRANWTAKRLTEAVVPKAQDTFPGKKKEKNGRRRSHQPRSRANQPPWTRWDAPEPQDGSDH